MLKTMPMIDYFFFVVVWGRTSFKTIRNCNIFSLISFPKSRPPRTTEKQNFVSRKHQEFFLPSAIVFHVNFPLNFRSLAGTSYSWTRCTVFLFFPLIRLIPRTRSGFKDIGAGRSKDKESKRNLYMCVCV